MYVHQSGWREGAVLPTLRKRNAIPGSKPECDPGRKPGRRPGRRSGRKGLILLVVLLLIAVLVLSAYLWLKNSPFASYEGVNILVLGTDINLESDTDESESVKDVRTDTIVVIGIRNNGTSVAALSVPRDTLVEVPGHGVTRVNAAHMEGGVDLTIETLEGFLDVPLQYYAKTNFAGFAGLIDFFGGIMVDVERDMKYTDYSQGLFIDLEQGYQHLNGDQALQYARFRNDRMGDIGRVARQQKVLKALAKEALTFKNILKWPQAYRMIKEYSATNLTLGDIIRLGWSLKNFSFEDFNLVTLPGEFYGVYWRAHMEAVTETVRETLAPLH